MSWTHEAEEPLHSTRRWRPGASWRLAETVRRQRPPVRARAPEGFAEALRASRVRCKGCGWSGLYRTAIKHLGCPKCKRGAVVTL